MKKNNVAPKVTVILTSYNHAKYISQAIESVLNQTFTDFELFIVDDGSSDNSREVIKTFMDKRIKTFLYEENRGPRIAIQESLKVARGKYLAIHHSDDLWTDDKLEKQVKFLEKNSDYAACLTWAEFIDEDGEPYEVAEKNPYYKIFEQENRSREKWLHDLFFDGNCFCNPSALLRNDKRLYQEMYGTCGLWQLPDYHAWINLIFKYNLHILTEKLTLFRLRRQKQENTSADRPDVAVRSEMELYRVLKEYRRLNKPKDFLKIFPEAEKFVVNKKILPQYALAKILQNSAGSARKLLALDILFDLINNKDSEKLLHDLYNYNEIDFVRENSEFGILYPAMKLRYLQTSLYYDIGEGFSEQNKLSSMVYVQRDGRFLAEYTLTEENKISALRFDPAEDEAISVKIISVKINGEEIACNANQPFKDKDGYKIFFTYDPQYILNYSGDGKIAVEICGEISKKYDSLHILRDENLQIQVDKNNQIGNLQGQLEGKNNQIGNLQDQLEDKNNQIGNLQGQLEGKNNQIGNLQGQLEDKNNQIGNLQDQLEDKNNQIGGLEWQLNEIYSSRGYKLIQKYYALRDWLLPKGSTRRLIIKNFAWAILNPSRALSLMTADNFKKAYFAWRHGGLRQLAVRSDTKINSPAVANIETSEKIQYGNDWLAEKKIFIIPNDVVVDIIMPIYNAYDFTKKCIVTVYENTDVAFNLYLIDDCSPDERISTLLEEVRQKEKPKLLRELKILRNEENLGFIGSVNRGFSLSKNNVVLLNTDTEVPPNWLSRLLIPMLEEKNIASVTPFTNSGEICSFPKFCQNNDLIEGLTVAEVDKIFLRYGDSKVCDMPTGVGFCMLLNRECLDKFGTFDKIFGKGYGEENDWCRRTAEKGYRHVHVRNLFVWHKHGASFAERVDKSKQQRLQENLAILSERYPDYNRLVQEYIQKDPAGANRNFLKHCVASESKKNIQGVMFLNHSMGGGAKFYQDNLIDELKKDWRIYEIEPLADGKTLLLKNFDDGEEKVADFDMQNFDSKNFSALLEALQINWIFINQLLTYPIPEVLNWIIESKIPYTFFGHDFFAVCPNYQLLDCNRKYCNAETDFEKCRKCLKNSNLNFTVKVDIADWRKNFQNFLAGAKEIIVPSNNTEEIFKKYYSAKITVREHKISNFISRTFKPEFAEEKILTVAVIGAIGDEKGSKIIYSLAEKIENSSLPIRLLVIGITNLHNETYTSASGKFKITGRYDNKKISNLLAQNKVGLVLIPSIWPETYSYTTAEAMNSGYPVMVFSPGAPADRVKKIGGGWILEEISDESVLKELKILIEDRAEILKQAKMLEE